MSIARELFKNYEEKTFSSIKEKMNGLASGQSPEVLFITCSDSRVMPNQILDTKAGELFVIRNAGNLIPNTDKAETSAEALTVQYAVDVLKVKEIVVCGHAKCGAMGGILDLDKLTGLKSVHSHLEKCSHDFDQSELETLRGSENGLETLIEKNVDTQMKNLMSYDFVQNAVQEGRLNIYGWVYDFVNGKVTYEKSVKEII